MRKTIIHVYYNPKGHIRVIAYTDGQNPRKGRKAEWDGPSKLVTGQKANHFGGTTWIETHAPVRVTR